MFIFWRFFVKRLILICLGLLFSVGASPSVQASCGCASCPIASPVHQDLGAGEARLFWGMESIQQDQPRVGRRNASVGEIGGHHDEVETINLIRTVGLAVAFSRRFEVEASVPFIHREHSHIHNHMGTPFNESWNFDGMGNARLKLRTTALETNGDRPLSIDVLTGVEFPTGLDHAANADGDPADPSLLPGNNAYAFQAGLGLRKTLSAKTLGGSVAELPLFIASTYQWNQPGLEKYRLGNVWLTNIGLAYPVMPKLGLLFQTNVKVVGRDEAGDTNEEVENSGGTYVYASPGIGLALSEAISAYAMVQFPVYQRVNGIQLTSPYNVSMGMSYRFSLN